MSNRNEFSAGLAAKFVGGFADAGGTPDEMNLMAQNTDVIRQALGILRGTATAVVTKILELVGTTKVMLTTGKFVAKDKFVLNANRNAEVKISYLGDNLRDWFLSGKGKIEMVTGPHPQVEVELSYRRLSQNSVDGPIVNELGGEAKAETTLAEVYGLMQMQPNGQKGALLNDGWWNIFYVRDTSGVLRAVDVYWRGAGWGVSADSVGDPFGWGAGDRVFSRNS